MANTQELMSFNCTRDTLPRTYNLAEACRTLSHLECLGSFRLYNASDADEKGGLRSEVRTGLEATLACWYILKVSHSASSQLRCLSLLASSSCQGLSFSLMLAVADKLYSSLPVISEAAFEALLRHFRVHDELYGLLFPLPTLKNLWSLLDRHVLMVSQFRQPVKLKMLKTMTNLTDLTLGRVLPNIIDRSSRPVPLLWFWLDPRVEPNVSVMRKNLESALADVLAMERPKIAEAMLLLGVLRREGSDVSHLPSPQDFLPQCLADWGNVWAKCAIIESLAAMGEESYFPSIVAAMATEEPMLEICAATALFRLGMERSAMLELLERGFFATKNALRVQARRGVRICLHVLETENRTDAESKQLYGQLSRLLQS